MAALVRFVWLVLGWNLVTILLGAWVRATGSGAGCGRSWPTCQGQVLPPLEGAAAIEFTHRAASGLVLVLVAALVWLVFRRVPAGHPARAATVVAAAATVAEALIGAGLVLFELVADDLSMARVVVLPLHLVNTLLLLAGLTLTAFFLLHPHPFPAGWMRQPVARAMLTVGLGMVLVAATGGVTALADTLFPKDGLGWGETGEHLLTRLRILHPFLAVVVGLVAARVASVRGLGAGGGTATAARAVILLVVAQFVLGFANVVAGTPLWLSSLHLLAADLLWVGWVWMSAGLLHQPREAPAPV